MIVCVHTDVSCSVLAVGRPTGNRVLLIGAAAAAGLVACGGRQQAPVARKGPAPVPVPIRAPNVLIVVVDTLRYDATGLSGRTGRTPFLELLAGKGVEFSRAYSTHDDTPPSHFSIMTGFVKGQFSRLDRPEHGLPFQLAQLGYSTFGVAANGNLAQDSMPVLRGFRHYANLYDSWMEMPEAGKAELLGGIDARIALYGGRRNNFNRAAVFCSWEHVRPKLERLLGQWASGTRPFFGFVNLMEPHDPYFPDPAVVHEEPCGHELPAGFDPDIRFRELPAHVRQPETIRRSEDRERVRKRIQSARGRAWALSEGLTPQQLALYRCRYDAEAREADRALAQLFAILERARLLDSTIVLITSDHGESFGEAGFVTHSLQGAGDVEATRRVPLLVLLPDRFGAAPARVHEPVTIADVAPTLYDLIGVDWQPLVRLSGTRNFGRSFVPQMGVKRDRSQAGTRRVSLPPDDGAVRSEGKPSDQALERLRALGYIE